jgi:anaerobic magnesium-protoporphyrin IX monomethyl ester cyclase
MKTKVANVNPHIIFVYPPASFSAVTRVGHFRMPLGSAYIIAYLRQKGFNARQFLSAQAINVGKCVNDILAVKPRTVGFTVYQSNYWPCQLVAKGLKGAAPGIIILFGGPTAAVLSREILKNNPYVDICVENEGEETCLEVLTRLEQVNFDLKKASLEKIKGISYRLDNSILKNPGRDIFPGRGAVPGFLDRFPSPYLSGVALAPEMGIITARGCNQHCVYCNCAVLSKRSITTHSVDRVIEELDWLSKKIGNHAKAVDIFDDAFTLLPGRALEICRGIIENKINIPLVCMTRCDTIDEELLEKMKEAGFKGIGFSLESAVPRILRRIGKVQPPNTKSDDSFEKEKEFIKKFKKYIFYARKIGIETVYTSIMLGLPTETPQEGRETVNLVRELGKALDFYSHNMLQVYPGTPLFYHHEQSGLELQMYDDQIHYKTIHPYDTSQIKVLSAPKSGLEEVGISQDRANMKWLALMKSFWKPGNLFSKRFPAAGGKSGCYVDTIILCADLITKELVQWLQEYLAINGYLIQVYRDFHRAEYYYRQNEDALINYGSPTIYHVSYYQTGKEDGVTTFIPFRVHISGKSCGIAIDWVNTKTGLSSANARISPLQSICIDREREDTLALYRSLTDLPGKDNLGEIPFYPYISSLCRWENIGEAQLNCRGLEIVIVDADNNIKTCWNGEPVGKIGTPLPGILDNLENLHKQAENRRGCKDCLKKAVCSKCIFPAPLSEAEYCDLRRRGDTGKGAGFLRSLAQLMHLIK